MPQELVNRQTGEITEMGFSREKVELLKRTIAKDHTDDELKMFLEYCKARALDPFAREVYSVKRQGKMTIQIGIDGLRACAEETGEYDGQDVLWCGESGQWTDVWLSKEPPAAAKVTIYRRGGTHPFVGIAKWDEYKPADNDWMWKKMPANQLAKCAEALALRKAFPRKLGGMYSTDEMRQASAPPIAMPRSKADVAAAVAVQSPTGPISEDERKNLQKKFFARCDAMGLSDEDKKKFCLAVTGKDSTKALAREDFEKLFIELDAAMEPPSDAVNS